MKNTRFLVERDKAVFFSSFFSLASARFGEALASCVCSVHKTTCYGVSTVKNPGVRGGVECMQPMQDFFMSVIFPWPRATS